MSHIKIKDISTRAPKEFDKAQTKQKTTELLGELDELQNVFYAEGKYSILVILQGMDASGKDGAINKVFTSINPQGIQVKSFKAPVGEETTHDFLWRIHPHAPAKGMIQIFNRSQYEDILITRVHKWCDDETAEKRIKAINNFEKLLRDNNNTIILKFYLHISKEEQKERLDERMVNPKKMWKYNPNDFKEAELWDDYMKMYDDCFNKCNEIPWIIVPSDQNWYKEYIIAHTLHKTLKSLKSEYPAIKK